MKLSLGVVLSLCIAGLQFIAVLIVVTSSYVSSQRALIEHAHNLLSDVAANTIEHSRSFLRPARGAVELATRLAENEIVASDNKELLEKLLFQQLVTAPQFAGVFYGDESGNFVYVMRSDGPGPFRSKLVTRDGDARRTELIWRDSDYAIVEQRDDPGDTYDPRQRPWYKRASSELTSIWTDPYIFFTSQKPGITVAAPVFGSGRELRGAIGVDIDIDAISGFLAQLSIGETGKALILNRNGDVIAHPNPELIKTRESDGSLRFMGIDEIEDPIARRAFGHLSQAEGTSARDAPAGTFEHDGDSYVSTIAHIEDEDLPWTIGVFAPEDDFIHEIKRNRLFNIAIAAIVAALTALVGLIMANHIHKPVRALALRATRISRGEYDLSEPFPKTFTELERANDTMMQEIARRKKSEQVYGRTFEQTSRGMAHVAPATGRFERVNQTICDMIGYDRKDLLRMSLSDIAHPDDAQDLLQPNTSEDPNHEYIREHRLVRQDGEIVFAHINAVEIHDEDGLPLHTVVTFDDITQIRLAEAQIRKLNHDLSHRERLNTMGEMAASLAHELNQPLTALTQNTDAALMTATELELTDTELLGILNDLDEQAHRAGDIIKALRSFVRKDEDLKTDFRLDNLLHQTVRLVQAEARENGVKINVNVSPMPLVHGSHVQIAQVLVNLLRNAIEAIAPTNDNQRRITVTAQQQGDKVRVDVADTGPGIDPSIELFAQFETTKPDGMGLGLPISRAIVEAHDGKLWYETSGETGGTFSFTLPVKE